jgi:hypothetical protein
MFGPPTPKAKSRDFKSATSSFNNVPPVQPSLVFITNCYREGNQCEELNRGMRVTTLLSKGRGLTG